MKEHFGELILSSINFFGLTQKQAANHLGITPQTLNHYIHGKRSIDLNTLRHIMWEFKMEPNYVFGWTTHQTLYSIKSIEEMELVAYVRSLSTHEQHLLLNYLTQYDKEAFFYIIHNT